MPSAMHGHPSPTSRFATATSCSPPWTEHVLQGDNGPPESSLTKRRREANRLAAQRFRSRKKGYQDSLEERVRVLENEKAILQDQLRAQPSSSASASPKDIKPANAFDAAAHEAVKELRRENARLRIELEESRGDANHWKDQARSLNVSLRGSYSSASSATHSKPPHHSETYKRRRTSEESFSMASPHEISPPIQLPTPQEFPFVTTRPSLPVLDLTSIQQNSRPPPLPSPSVFLCSHSNSAESFKLAPLRLPPSPALAPARNGFEILLAVGQGIDGKSPCAEEPRVNGMPRRA